MRAAEANVIYTPGTDRLCVVRQDQAGDAMGALAPDQRWCGVVAGDADNRLPTTAAETERMVFITFHTLVVRDGMDVAATHRAFLQIDEYRWSCCPDLAGAQMRPPQG